MAEKPRVLMNEARNPVVGVAAPYSRIDAGTIRFVGPTGLVGTGFGAPGLTATRMATGHYRVHMARSHDNPSPAHVQKWQAQAVSPTGFQAPTGVGFGVQLANRSPASGTIDLFITKASPTGINQLNQIPANPTHNSEVDLLIFTTPITKY